MNLLFVVGIFLMAYLACGGVLFEEGSLDARANYDHFVQGFITLFQSKFKGLITFFQSTLQNCSANACLRAFQW